jgi:LysM repeat protein
LAALLVAGLCIAPIAWALRGDGNAVDITETGGAAAIVQFDTNGDSTTTVIESVVVPASVPVTVAPTTVAATVPVTVPETVAPTTEAPKRVCASKYIVQAGDSWFGIADRAGVKASLIAGSNNKTIQSPLMVGQEICLPPGATVPAPIEPNVVSTTTPKIVCVGKYTVKTGDSWSGIATKVGVKISELTAANGKTSRSTLLPGQELCLPKGAVTSSAAAPSTQAPTTTQPPKYVPTKTFTRAELEKFVRDAWPDNLEENAFYVVHRESRWNPLSRNSCCIGLFQLNWNAHKSWMKNYGITDASELLNPEINAKLAYVTWQRSGSWRPWCTTNWCPTP